MGPQLSSMLSLSRTQPDAWCQHPSGVRVETLCMLQLPQVQGQGQRR